MAEPSPTFLQNQITTLRGRVTDLENRLHDVEEGQTIYVSQSDLHAQIQMVNDQMNDFNAALATIENKLNKIFLPSDTRFYLQQSEITDFRNNFRQLRAMMADLEKSRQAFIKLAARFNMTNSQL